MKKLKELGNDYACPDVQVMFLWPDSGLCQTSNVTFTEIGFEDITDDGNLN